jgi:hypothetical protein
MDFDILEPQEWERLCQEEAAERVRFRALDPAEAQAELRQALPMHNVRVPLDAGPESF